LLKLRSVLQLKQSRLEQTAKGVYIKYKNYLAAFDIDGRIIETSKTTHAASTAPLLYYTLLLVIIEFL